MSSTPSPPSLRSRTITSAAGLAFGLGAVAASRGVARWESIMLRRVNGWPDSLHGPAWVVMQFGSLGSVILNASVAFFSGRSPATRTIATSGVAAWWVCKPLKRLVRRGRPNQEGHPVQIRGKAATGLGYPSGHAAVAVALAIAMGRGAQPGARAALAATAATVGLSRVYVGAHFPLDVFGGVAVGLVASTWGQYPRR